jgi:demethyllactenocin mycarosyltransferase
VKGEHVAHIAFTSIPYGGHVNPTLAVVTALVARGHRVSYVTTAEFQDRVTAAGARAVTCTTTMKDDGRRRATVPFDDPYRYSTSDLTRLLTLLLTETLHALPQLDRVFRTDPPDLIVHDTSYWAGDLMAGRLGVPRMASHVMMASAEHWSLDSSVHTFDAADDDLRAVAAAIGRLGHRLGVPVDARRLCAGIAREPMLVYLPRAFQPRAEGFPAGVHFVGPCLSERGFHGSWSPPAGADRVVLVALGSTFSADPGFYRSCIKAFTGTGWHAVIAVGDTVDPTALGPLPPGIEVHRFVAQLDVLRHASAFVSHTGMGSTMESLSHGVPIVAVPQMAEQRANADRIVELGLGRRLDAAERTPAGIRAAVEAVADDQAMATRIRVLREEIHRAGGAPAAADQIERQLTATAAHV